MCNRSPGQGHSYRLAGSLAARGGREIPARFSTFQTVECAKPVAPATSRGPQPVSRRQAQIRSCRLAASSRGDLLGRLERSNRQAPAFLTFLTLMGERSWYIPRWLDRLLPNITIEAPHDSEPPATLGSERTA